MPNTTITVSEEIEVNGEMSEFIFKVPVLVTETKGQRGQYGVPLEPDTQNAEINGPITVIDQGEELNRAEFLERYDNANIALENVTENRQRLYDRASQKLKKHSKRLI